MIGLLMLAAVTSGSFPDGDALYALCGSEKDADKGACLGYVMGGFDAATIMQSAGNLRIICAPQLAGEEQVRGVVVNYLRDNPATRHKPAGAVIIDALQKAFPCAPLRICKGINGSRVPCPK